VVSLLFLPLSRGTGAGRCYDGAVRGCLPAVVLAGCFSTPGRPGNLDAPTIASGFHRSITISTPPAKPLQRFAVSVVLENDAGLAAHAPSAANIAFTNVGNVALDCEVVHYSANGTLEAWVTLPTLSSTESRFELVYGPDVVSPCRAEQPWGEFRGVWHLADAVAGTAADSSRHGHMLTAGTAGAGMRQVGMVGDSVRFDPGDPDGPDQLCIADAPELNLGTASFSVDLWVLQEVFLGEYDEALFKGGSNPANAGFDFELGATEWLSYVRDAANNTNIVRYSLNATPLLNQWAYLTLVVDREAGEVRSYRDAIETASEALVATSLSGTDPFCIGNSAQPMRGRVDEVRVHDVARPPEWIKASYSNVSQRASFMSISPER
jgi:hypothetical protein